MIDRATKELFLGIIDISGLSVCRHCYINCLELAIFIGVPLFTLVYSREASGTNTSEHSQGKISHGYLSCSNVLNICFRAGNFYR